MLSKMETILRFVGANTNKFKPPQLGLPLWDNSMWKLSLHVLFHLYLNPHSTSIALTSLLSVHKEHNSYTERARSNHLIPKGITIRGKTTSGRTAEKRLDPPV